MEIGKFKRLATTAHYIHSFGQFIDVLSERVQQKADKIQEMQPSYVASTIKKRERNEQISNENGH